MNATLVLGRRSLRETTRTMDSLLPTMFIPLFFLVVNTGQVARIFPTKTTGFLGGQGYAAFLLPSSLLLAASFGAAALYLVEEIEGGYFDKLRATPISRASIVFGRLAAEVVKSVAITTAMIVVSFPFGVRIRSGFGGYVVLVVIVALWAAVFSGFMQLPQDTQRCSNASRQHGVLSAALPHTELRSTQRTRRTNETRIDPQPSHLHNGSHPLADPERLRMGCDRSWFSSRWNRLDRDGYRKHPNDEPLRLTPHQYNNTTRVFRSRTGLRGAAVNSMSLRRHAQASCKPDRHS
jgi:ABC-2 type transporter